MMRSLWVFVICIFSFLVLMFGVNFVFSQDEDITITTYFPSPFGSYNELSVASRMAVGDVNGDGQINGLDMATDNPGNPLPGTLTVANRIGIGTINPRARLDVNGAIRYQGPLTGTIFYGGGFNLGETDAPGARSDGYRVRYDGNFFGADRDALVFEKADGNALVTDGGIAFVSRGSTGLVNTDMVIRDRGVAINGLLDSGTYGGGAIPQHKTDLDVNGYTAVSDLWIKDHNFWVGDAITGTGGGPSLKLDVYVEGVRVDSSSTKYGQGRPGAVCNTAAGRQGYVRLGCVANCLGTTTDWDMQYTANGCNLDPNSTCSGTIFKIYATCGKIVLQ